MRRKSFCIALVIFLSFFLLFPNEGQAVIPSIIPSRNTVLQHKKEVKGVVLDELGQPVIGANIAEKGTINGTATNIDGAFTLTVDDINNRLVISYIGYKTKEIIVNDQFMTISLEPDFLMLDDVVVTGYNTQRKKDLTGAVSVLDISDVSTTPVSSVDQMMQGKLSGINVIPDNMPGGGVAVRIRGFSTIRNNDPLYIIDGVPVEGGINFINPNDIESMQVLKDASSASIYGARAANGVVIISTKKGKEGKLKISLDTYWGVQTSAKKTEMLNAQEFGDKLWEAHLNDGKTPTSSIYGSGTTAVIPAYIDDAERVPSADTDWVDAILKNALVQSYNLTFSKADKEAAQLFSVAYFNQDGLMKYTGFERLSGRFNSSYNLFNSKLKIGENLSLSHSWGTTVTNNAALGGMLYNAYKMSSITPIYDLDGNFGSNPFADIANPLGQLYRNKDNLDKNTRLFGNVYIEITPIKDFSVKSNFGSDYRNRYKRSFSPKYTEMNTQQPLSTLSVLNYRYFNWVFTNTLNYNKEFDNQIINALAGVEATNNRSEWFSRLYGRC